MAIKIASNLNVNHLTTFKCACMGQKEKQKVEMQERSQIETDQKWTKRERLDAY